ncbi:MAG: hypothetical protein RBT71_10380 [Flavobacteriales bacterium]|jgi:hypothetical protein|nr:hypothetical protein [Flavobacteriales bacterium]
MNDAAFVPRARHLAALLLLAAAPLHAQVTAGEWFIGSDPGFGQGHAISFTPGGTVAFDQALTAPLAPGPHVLYMRVRDAAGRWSHTQARHLHVQRHAPGHVLTDAEWFIGDDPGFGQGTAVDLAPGATAELDAVLPAAPGPGAHVLHLRARDAHGQWGHTHARHLHAHRTHTGVQLQAGEWFIGDDPGFGQGEPLAFDPADTLSALAFGAPVIAPGPLFRWAGVRTLDDAGNWGHTAMRPLLVRPGGAGVIAAAEWFIGDDPGFGLGQAIDVGQPAPLITDLLFAAMTQGLGTGDHVLYVRVFNDDGVPSQSYPVAFTVLDPTGVGELLGDDLRAGPNPTTGDFILRTEKPVTGMQLRLVDGGGRTVLEAPFTGDRARLDLAGFAAGTYHLFITDAEGGHRVLAVVKQ